MLSIFALNNSLPYKNDEKRVDYFEYITIPFEILTIAEAGQQIRLKDN